MRDRLQIDTAALRETAHGLARISAGLEDAAGARVQEAELGSPLLALAVQRFHDGWHRERGHLITALNRLGTRTEQVAHDLEHVDTSLASSLEPASVPAGSGSPR